jgi:fermentation-respiration switch protein FrsA (DUF1100 family)
LLACVALWLGGCLPEERFIFFPHAEIPRTPREAGLEFEDLFFETEDGLKLNGWYIRHPRPIATLLWFHGNAGNIGHRVENLRLLHGRVPVNVFIFDYRGYGRSQGTVSEAGTYRDGSAALAYLRRRADVDPETILFFGRSLGAAVAAELASRERCLALILETPFASIGEMARDLYPFLPLRPLLRTRYDTVEKVQRVRAPVLVVHGDRDEIVPLRQAKKVFAAAPEPKRFYVIRGARHNDTYLVGGEAYFATLKSFIESALERRAPSSSR